MKISASMYRALCYADVFHFPLTLEEMKKYAIKHGKSFSQETLVKRSVFSRGYYCLKGSEACIYTRMQNLKYVDEKMDRARFAAKIFSMMPTVLGVFVTGGLAVGNVKPDDDIDFMIVTKQGWLWTTRFVLVLISKLLGKYTHKRIRREDATAADANTWCLNMWLDETALAVPFLHRNLYTAHEVIQALPLIHKQKIAERFLWANRWVEKEINCTFMHMKNKDIYMHRPAYQSMIDRIFHIIQKPHEMKQTVHAVKFFPHSTGEFVLGLYKDRMYVL